MYKFKLNNNIRIIIEALKIILKYIRLIININLKSSSKLIKIEMCMPVQVLLIFYESSH